MTDKLTPQDTHMIFAPLKAALEAQPSRLADLMQLIAGFNESDPGMGQAMTLHVRDIDMEQSQIPAGSEGAIEGWPSLIAEVYRRTFFDLDYARLYGTTAMLKAGPDALQRLAQSIIDGLLMDNAELATLHQAPSAQQ